MSDIESLGTYLEEWLETAPSADEVSDVTRDGIDALIQAGMVQYKADGWDFKLHEKHPDAPRAEFKLMIREAPGVDTNPAYYDRFTLPGTLQAGESGQLDGIEYVLGYPNAGTAIAAAFKRLVAVHFGIQLVQLEQAKVVHDDGKRELGDITTPFVPGKKTRAADDTATGGDTKIEGYRKITEQGLSYAGLMLIVERDPLGSELVRQRTGEGVYPSMHWMTVVQRAAKVLELPSEAIAKELTYPKRLFEWNVANNNLGSLPDASLIAPRT